MAHSLNTLLNSAKILKKKYYNIKIQFLFLGSGAEKSKLIERAKELNLDNVTFIDSVSKSQVAQYWSILDASIVHLRNAKTFESVIPSKIFECMGWVYLFCTV